MKTLTQSQALSLITHFKDKFYYKYIYATSIVKIANRANSRVYNDNINKFLFKINKLNDEYCSNEAYKHILTNEIYTDIENSNDYYIFAYKVKNKKDSKHKGTIHYHCILLSKKELSFGLVDNRLSLFNNSIFIKEISDKKNLNNWLSYIYNNHKIKNISSGICNKINIMDRKRKNLYSHIDILFMLLSTPYKAFNYTNVIQYVIIIIKTNKGIYNKYVYL